MKKLICFGVIILSAITFACFSACTLIQVSTSKSDRLKYYSDDNNYIARKGKVDLFSDKSASSAWIKFDVICEDDTSFNAQYVIDEYSRKILIENGFWETLVKDMEVTFMTAERVFYELQKAPIVEISVNGITYLKFEDGKRNLLASIEQEI